MWLYSMEDLFMLTEISLSDIRTFFFLIIKYIVNLLCLSVHEREIMLTDNNLISEKEREICLENVK